MRNYDARIVRGLPEKKTFSEMMLEPFDDGGEYMSALFDIGYIDEENIFGLVSDGTVLSSFCVIPALLKRFGENIPAYVMSYVVTPEEYRGHGFSQKLISSFLENADIPVFVFPSEKSLFSYYSRLGFKNCAFSKRRVFENAGKRGGVFKTDFCDEIYKIYLSSKKENEIYKSEKLFRAAVKEAEISDGGLFSDGESYAFFYREKGKNIVTEPFGKDIYAVAKALSENEKVYLTLPSEKKDEPLAMFYSATDGDFSDVFLDNFLNLNQYI